MILKKQPYFKELLIEETKPKLSRRKETTKNEGKTWRLKSRQNRSIKLKAGVCLFVCFGGK